MAKQWGNVDGDEALLPNWFKDTNVVDDSNNVTQKNVDRPHQPNSNQEIAASDKGWERTVTYVDSNGNIRKKSEVLVAQGKLATTFVKPAIVDATFDVGAYATTDTVRVNVRFSEDVSVSTPVPTLAVTHSTVGALTLTYDGSSGQEFSNNVVSFVDSGNAGGNAGDTLLIELAAINNPDSVTGVTTSVDCISETLTSAMTDDQQITLT